MYQKRLRRALAVTLGASIILVAATFAADLYTDLNAATAAQNTTQALGNVTGGSSGSINVYLYYTGNNVDSLTFAVDQKPSFVTSVTGGTLTGADQPSGQDSTVDSVISWTAPCELGAFSGQVTYKVTSFSGTGSVTVTNAFIDISGNVASLGSNCASYDIVGFYQPVNNIQLNGAKAGSTIPLKFDILLDEVEQTDTALVTSFIQRFTCESGNPVDMLTTEELSSGSTSLRWDATGEQFIFNWKTPKSPGCYRVTVTVDGGDSITADFQLR